MSSAHKGSRLLLSGNLIPVDYPSTHFDYENDATGIRSGQLILPSSASVYSWRQAEGKFGGGIAVEEGTTNMWTMNTTIYNNFNSNGQMTSTLTTLTETFNGYPIYRLQMTPISANAVTDVQTNLAGHGVMSNGGFAFQSGNIYTSSIYWRAYKSDIVVGGTASNIAGWSDIGTYKYNDNWNRSVSQWNSNTTASDDKFWSFKSPSAVANETITIDWSCPQIEQKTFTTSYSPSSRGYGIIDYGDAQNYINQQTYTISMWVNSYRYGKDPSHTADWNMAFSLSPAFYIGVNMGNDLVVSIVDSNGIQQRLGYSYNFIENNWYHIGYSYNSGTIKMYLNGKLIATTSLGTSSVHYQRNTGETRNLYIGGYHTSGVYSWNGVINDVRIDRTALSDEDFMAMYISNKPLYNPYDYRATAY